VRIDSFRIVNYKGVEYAEMGGLGSESVVTISGRNGTGKSLILEALVNAWVGRHDLRQKTGPWGDEVSVSVAVTLDDREFEVVSNWQNRSGGQPLQRQASYV
jgi:recombinational DNA repair ATPase RecF